MKCKEVVQFKAPKHDTPVPPPMWNDRVSVLYAVGGVLWIVQWRLGACRRARTRRQGLRGKFGTFLAYKKCQENPTFSEYYCKANREFAYNKTVKKTSTFSNKL